MKQHPNNGVVPAPHDPRDYRVHVAASVQLPKEAIKECAVPHADQQVGKCTMCAAEPALTEYYGYPVTGNWGYGYFRESGHNGIGLYIRDAYGGLCKYGLPRAEADIPETEVRDVINTAHTYAPRILPLAAEHAGWTYYRLDTKEEIMAAIARSLNVRGMRVVFSTCVDGWGMTTPDGWLPYSEGGGHHMMMILGYGEHFNCVSMREGVKVRNSWGKDFGLEGDCWMTWDAVMENEDVYLLMPPTSEPIDGDREDQIKDETDFTTRRTLRLKDKPRMQGEDVRELQRLLNWHGAHLEVDGIFGPATDAAVRQFQTENGLTADGIVGEKTWAALYAEPETPAKDYMELAEDMTRLLRMMVGDHYIIGGQGHKLTLDYLNARNKAYPQYFTGGRLEWLKEEISRAESMGREIRCEDCSGLFFKANELMKIIPESDMNANGLWRSYCEEIAFVDLRPLDILFRESDGKMAHMAVVGVDGVYEAAGTAYGVVFRPWVQRFDRETHNRMTGKIDALKAWTHAGRLKL